MSKKKAPKKKAPKKKTMKKNEQEFDLINTACAQYDSPLQITNLFGKDFSRAYPVCTNHAWKQSSSDYKRNDST